MICVHVKYSCVTILFAPINWDEEGCIAFIYTSSTRSMPIVSRLIPRYVEFFLSQDISKNLVYFCCSCYECYDHII